MSRGGWFSRWIDRVGLFPPREGPDPYAHRRGEPRSFAVLWLAFVVAATMVTLGAVGLSGVLYAEVYRPAARGFFAVMGAGIVLFWPMVRLSQERAGRPVRSACEDGVIVGGSVAAVTLPQSLPWMAGWPWDVTLTVGGVLMGWVLAVAGVLAWHGLLLPSARPKWWARSWNWMAAIVIVASVGPMAEAVGVAGTRGDGPRWGLMASPATVTFEAARDRSYTGRPAAVGQGHRWWAWGTLGAGACVLASAWGVGGRVAGRRARASRHGMPMVEERV